MLVANVSVRINDGSVGDGSIGNGSIFAGDRRTHVDRVDDNSESFGRRPSDRGCIDKILRKNISPKIKC